MLNSTYIFAEKILCHIPFWNSLSPICNSTHPNPSLQWIGWLFHFGDLLRPIFPHTRECGTFISFSFFSLSNRYCKILTQMTVDIAEESRKKMITYLFGCKSNNCFFLVFFYMKKKIQYEAEFLFSDKH